MHLFVVEQQLHSFEGAAMAVGSGSAWLGAGTVKYAGALWLGALA